MPLRARVRGGGAPARPRLLPHRQRRLRRHPRLLRADHARAPPRAPPAGPARLRLRRQVGRRAPHRDRRRHGDRGGRDHAASALEGRPAAAGLPGRPLVAIGDPRPGQRLRARRPRGWRPPPRTSAPGTPRCSPPPRWPRRTEPGETKASRKRAVAAAMREVSEFLGNTPALARSSYVDPRVVEAYERGLTISGTTRRTYETPDERQAALERATLRLIRAGGALTRTVPGGARRQPIAATTWSMHRVSASTSAASTAG